MPTLNNGDTFPSLSLDTVGGSTIPLPDVLAVSFGVILIYRGSWCPYCNAQLAGFSRAADTFTQLGIKVVTFSVDDEATTVALVDKHHLAFPAGHSADADKIAQLTGAYTTDNPHYLHSTGFVLAPDGTVITAVYSYGAIGRLVADDVAGLVRYAKSQN